MADLRERLRAADPARHARSLDQIELAAMRAAMRAAPVPRPFAGWRLAAAFAVATSTLAIALLVLRWGGDAPAPLATPTQAPVVVAAPPPSPMPEAPKAAPALAVVKRRLERPRPAPADPAQPQVREVRFVTESGTQILWTFRSREEGA
jgi:hypothetical protein